MVKHVSVAHDEGDKVRIIRADKKLDPNVYKVVTRDRNITLLECETGEVIKVHYSRIVERLGAKVITPEDAGTATSGQAEAKTTTKAKTTRKAKKAQKFDFKAFMSDKADAEHWSRAAKANVQKKQTRTHAILYKDGTSWQKLSFNTYDGCLGPKGKLGKPYDVKDYDRAVTQLSKSGYKKVTHV